MSRKNKYLRAFLHQTQNPTIEQAWDCAWKHAQKTFHARSMQDMREQLAAAQAETRALQARVAELSEAPRYVRADRYDAPTTGPGASTTACDDQWRPDDADGS